MNDGDSDPDGQPLNEDVPDDARHVQLALAWMTAHPDEQEQLQESFRLLHWILASLPDLRWEELFSNDFSARAAHVRAYRDLRACTQLLLQGYYEQVGALLRSAYEAASLGRYLAKEPDVAERWLKKREWFPEAAVRKWMRESSFLGLSDAQLRDYDHAYRHKSAFAHPTAVSCLARVSDDHERPRFRLTTDFDEMVFQSWLREVLATAVYCCFAVRNSAVREDVLDPDWRRAVADLAEQVTGRDLPHLHRAWEEEIERYRAHRSRVRDVAHLEDALATHPLSDRNIRRG